MLKKIDHINIVVSDLEKATDFFCRLGFTIEHRGDLEGEWIASIVNLKDVRASYVQLSFRDSAVHIELLKYNTPASSENENTSIPNQIGIRHIAFEVAGIEKIVSDLKDDGVNFFGDVQVYPQTGKKLVYFYGPDQIILELAEYPP
jgi:catechol 2,3-dioxygenase-like lactoylglutathione lyase family enzyme